MRFLILSAAFLAAACASNGASEDVARAPAPPVAASEPVDAPTVVGAGASGVTLPAEPAPPPRGDEDVTVPGARDIPVPSGTDPRTTEQRMAHIRSWDNCVMRLQGDVEANPTRPALQSPEEVCSARLGMASRTAIPDSFGR